ncbi:FAD-dependent oxidoreductase [Chloroflexota bacterium]
MKLFEPGRIGNLRLKNRIVMAPMVITGLVELDGRISPRAIDYYVARAKGGAGLITTGVFYVDQEVENHLVGPWATAPRADSIVYVTRLAELADEVHDYGAKLSIQLTAGFGRVAPPPHYKTPVAPSPLPSFSVPKVICREITTEEVKKLVAAFGMAARFVKNAGIDTIELNGHEGYLFDQFLTSLWNKRTDKYGGNLDGRLRFSLEVIEAIKREAGANFPVIYRFGLKHYLQGSREVEESLEMVRRFEQAGVDALHVDAGCYEARHWAHPPTYQSPGCTVDCAEDVKKVVSIPVIAVGKLGYPELAESILQEGRADFIALGRALLADPEWPNKVNEGRLNDIRPCIGDHDGCMGRIVQRKYISCTVNPATGNEQKLALIPAEKHKSVLVVGGGPGGMEAARVAALRGHQVVLWEKSDRLGGNLVPASVPEFKSDLRLLINYLSSQLEKLKVDLHLDNEATPEIIQQMCPDVLIIATGAIPIIPEIPGVEKSIVATAIDILLGKKDIGEEIVVIGGGLVGCEIAAFLAAKGKKVTIVEMMRDLVPDMYMANRHMLLEMLARCNVKSLTDTTAIEIVDDGVIIKGNSGDKINLKADTVALAAGMKTHSELQDKLKDNLPIIHAVGDCIQPRKIINAIWEAYRIARLI